MQKRKELVRLDILFNDMSNEGAMSPSKVDVYIMFYGTPIVMKS